MDRSIFQDNDVTFKQKRVVRLGGVITSKNLGGKANPKVDFEEAIEVTIFIRGKEIVKRYMTVTIAGNASNKPVGDQNDYRRPWKDTKLDVLRTAIEEVERELRDYPVDLEYLQERKSAFAFHVAKEVGETLNNKESAQ